ncbi:glutamine-hydrolyzing GMP synthase, partial [bacterium]|nr:glutamine-hydrolyzing GMP synthase [bacterium]
MILLVDFGSQTTHLIGRRLRELGHTPTIIAPEDVAKYRATDIKGIILSGGPASVYEKSAPTIDKDIFTLGIPILGICYGQQLTCHLLGGIVKQGSKKEYGPAQLTVKKQSGLFEKTAHELGVWMSHGDEIVKPPAGFDRIGTTETIPYATIENNRQNIYGIQFHPEVVHTQFGTQILSNFLKICKLTPQKYTINRQFVTNLIEDVKNSVGNKKAVCALSGGVDSSVAALLVHKAIGDNLTSIYIDSGLMREGETEALKKIFETHFHMNILIIDAKRQF